MDAEERPQNKWYTQHLLWQSEVIKERREKTREHYLLEEMKECSFKPEINDIGQSSRCRDRAYIENLGKKMSRKREGQGTHVQELEEPKTNSNSPLYLRFRQKHKDIIEARRSSQERLEALLIDQQAREYVELMECTFHPKISPRPKEAPPALFKSAGPKTEELGWQWAVQR